MSRYNSNLVKQLTKLNKPYTAQDILYHYTYAVFLFHDFNRTRTAKTLRISLRGLRIRIHEMEALGFKIPKGKPGAWKISK